MNAAPEKPPVSSATRARRVRGWWLAALAMFVILLLSALGWLPSYIALPAIVAVATLMAIEIRSASRGVAIDAAPRLVSAAIDPTAGLVALVDALPEPALLVDRAGILIAGNVPAAFQERHSCRSSSASGSEGRIEDSPLHNPRAVLVSRRKA